MVRREFLRARGAPGLIAIHQKEKFKSIQSNLWAQTARANGLETKTIIPSWRCHRDSTNNVRLNYLAGIILSATGR